MALVRALFLLCSLSVVFVRAQTAPHGQLLLIEIDPGHSHISSLHSNSLAGVLDEVHIYSPLTPELAAHMAALSGFNARVADPTHWSVRLFAGPDYLSNFARESAGNVVALSGRNEKKIEYVRRALEAGQNVFADKPWIITTADLPKLEDALRLAQNKGLVTYDWMTLRGNVAYRMQRDLVQDAAVFGRATTGSSERPAVRLQNLHALLKYSNGVAQRRPASFLDIRQQGEGMADVGTHLADLVQWTLFPGQAISYARDIRVLSAQRSALTLTSEQFTRLTGQPAWPAYLKPDLRNDQLQYFANGSCIYTLRGVYVQLKVGWQFEAPPGAQDTYFASYSGSRSSVELRAGAKENYVPELYVIPESSINRMDLETRLREALSRLSHGYPGVSVEKTDEGFHVVIPKSDRSGDDLHSIFEQFAGYVRDRETFPESENVNMLAKYYVTTTAVAMANRKR